MAEKQSIQERLFYIKQALKNVERNLKDAYYQMERIEIEHLGPTMFGSYDFEAIERSVLGALTGRFVQRTPEQKKADFGVLYKPYIFYGHVFGTPRAERKGMNHTAESYRVCERCGRSDVSLQSEAVNGMMPPCK